MQGAWWWLKGCTGIPSLSQNVTWHLSPSPEKIPAAKHTRLRELVIDVKSTASHAFSETTKLADTASLASEMADSMVESQHESSPAKAVQILPPAGNGVDSVRDSLIEPCHC